MPRRARLHSQQYMSSFSNGNLPSVPIAYTIASSTPHSDTYSPDNIIEDKPQDSSSRWSGTLQGNGNQWIILKLNSMAIISALCFLRLLSLLIWNSDIGRNNHLWESEHARRFLAWVSSKILETESSRPTWQFSKREDRPNFFYEPAFSFDKPRSAPMQRERTKGPGRQLWGWRYDGSPPCWPQEWHYSRDLHSEPRQRYRDSPPHFIRQDHSYDVSIHLNSRPVQPTVLLWIWPACCRAYGHKFNTSIWHVSMIGITEPEYIERTWTWVVCGNEKVRRLFIHSCTIPQWP